MARVMWTALVAALAAGPAWGEEMRGAQPADTLPPRSVEGRRLSAPDWQEAAGSWGLKLDAVHTVDVDEVGVVHVRHPIAQKAPESEFDGSRRLYSGTTRRDFVRLLMKLNVIAYTTNDPYKEAVMKPILDAGDSLFGSSVTTYADEKAKGDEAIMLRKTEVNDEGNASVADGGFGLDTAPGDSKGVHALEFSAPEVGKVLVFRGSFSSGDFDNIKPWISEWVKEKMTAMMKNQWVTVAGLPWTQQMQDAKDQIDLMPSETILSGGTWWYSSSFRDAMVQIAEEKGLDANKVGKTGYWEFSKAIADSVRSSLGENETLTISGHSQGGARAALISMYLEKKYGEKHDTVTFAATGGSCFSRDLAYTSGNMLDDVDPYVSHDQVTEYVHPLDVYGYLDYDVGDVCVYGTQGLAESRAKKYCEPVFGHQAADLMVAGSVPGSDELSQKFAQCRYFTHAWYAMNVDLMDDNVLLEDGKTDGGCKAQAAIPKDDSRCPDVTLNLPDGCNDELSCESCSISTSPGGLSCKWCEAEEKCRSTSATWFWSCSSEWKTCSVANTAGMVPGTSVAVAAAVWSMLLLGASGL